MQIGDQCTTTPSIFPEIPNTRQRLDFFQEATAQAMKPELFEYKPLETEFVTSRRRFQRCHAREVILDPRSQRCFMDQLDLYLDFGHSTATTTKLSPTFQEIPLGPTLGHPGGSHTFACFSKCGYTAAIFGTTVRGSLNLGRVMIRTLLHLDSYQ